MKLRALKHAKFAWQDHDSDLLYLNPPILNQWYTVFQAANVRLLWCRMVQGNTETANKHLAIRWTIDGTVYFIDQDAISGTAYFVYRSAYNSDGGTLGLYSVVDQFNGARYVDKRGLDFCVQMRIVTALGTNQTLGCLCVRETLEAAI